MLILVLILALILCVVTYIKRDELNRFLRNKIKGKVFEIKMKKIVLKHFPNARIRQNIIIKNGRYSKEIDLIAMTTKGFFIVEAKNYNGCRIRGKVDARNWTCKYNNGKSYSLYNPIFQAEAGVRSLNKYIPNINFNKMIVFSNFCDIDEFILNHKDIYKLSSFECELINMKGRNDLYSPLYIDDICKKIDKIETVTRSQHLKNIESIKKEKIHYN